ncbi:hypothetical protein EZH22_08075 [Xanthobacter dioxanivorans]|uniref:Uncharacterized protein n=1 Tax=Xanthobacter dioxanivorans TaxID=2528964 RepID=A0A974PRW6_9HYPH|nr:hypothetical protein [Xanthobacter dioxanivorans]QRG08254.1 hypothetical protein EZH22_08075 [Xanthobacter dioxanivorans]
MARTLAAGAVVAAAALPAGAAPVDDYMAARDKAVEKGNKTDDPRWDEINTIGDEGSAAFRACFAREAQPFLAAAVKRAEALLATARGN